MKQVKRLIRLRTTDNSEETLYLRSHYNRYRPIPESFIAHDEKKINKLNQCLIEKWDHVMQHVWMRQDTYRNDQMRITLHVTTK